MRFLELFDSISVISLADRADNRRVLWADLEASFPAADVERIEVFDAIRCADRGPFSRVGEHGCFLSHLGVLENALEQGAETLLVIEDDAEFLPSFATHLDWVTEQLQRVPWDMVNFGWHCDDAIFTEEQLDLRPSLVGSHAPVQQCHFMAFRQPAIEGLAAHLRAALAGPAGDHFRGPMPVDGAYNTYCWLNPDTHRLFTVPAMVGQRSSRSDITPRGLDLVPALRPMMSWLRHTGALDRAHRFN